MFYYMYQITNLVNSKIYIGVHKTKSLNDAYMGSGKIIKRAVAKYGSSNFKKDILELFENKEAMYAKEAQVVNKEFLLQEDVYNLRLGGYGGFDYINDGSKEHKARCSRAGKRCKELHPDLKPPKITKIAAAKSVSTRKLLYGKDCFSKMNLGIPKSAEHKEKISVKAKLNTHLYIKVICPHCNKEGAKNAMLRYHFDKCKHIVSVT